MKYKSTIAIISGIALVAIFFDQVTKHLARVYLLESGEGQIPILGDWFKFTYIENPGIAFGIEIYGGLIPTIILTLIALIGISYYFYIYRQDSMWYKVCYGLILGGSLGNLTDRLLFAKVTDFIHIDLYQGYVWDIYVSTLPIFNLADLFITTAICIIVIGQKKIFSPSITSSEKPIPTETDSVSSATSTETRTSKEEGNVR